MLLTKNDMARVIVQALRNMPELPPADHFHVVRLARAPKHHLADQHKTAVEILANKI